jgi:hypothetical protein
MNSRSMAKLKKEVREELNKIYENGMMNISSIGEGCRYKEICNMKSKEICGSTFLCTLADVRR